MKIVHCFFTMGMGGAQVLAIDLLNKMSADHQTYLIVVNDVVSEAVLKNLDAKVAVYKIHRKEGSRNPWPLIQFNLLLRKIRPDIIHCHEPDIGRIIKAGVGKLIYTIHGMGIPTKDYHYYRTLVAISDAVQDDVTQRFDRPIKKVYNGIDTSSFKERNWYVVKNEKIKLVQLSRLAHEIKGQDVLLEALHHLKTEYNYTNFSLDFVGIGPSIEYLKKIVASLNLTNEVVFAGEKDRAWLSANLAHYHLLVQPSRNEGFGLTLLEGFAAGLPILASDIEGPAEIISRTPRGFLFERGNSRQCAALLYQIIQDYENGNMEQLMNRSEPITNKEYSIDSCVMGYIKEYKALIS
jgi:glycosyltransferase involved in cell wall biosynthesis